MTSTQVVTYLDAQAGDEVPRRFSPTLEIGRSGLNRVSGYVNDEFLPQLKGKKGVKIFREISTNSPLIAGWLVAIVQLLVQIEWPVECEKNSPAKNGMRPKEFIESAMKDMSHSWGDGIREWSSFLPYGYNLSELMYKRRVGPWESDPRRRSQHTDGLIGWRKIAGRSQDTIERWIFDDEGTVLGAVQQAPPIFDKRILPIEKCLLFRTTPAKGNPEGLSVLRGCYLPWYYLKRHQEIEAVGVSRDLAGMPMASIPSKYLQATPGTEDAIFLDAIKKMVTSVARNENEGIVWPLDYQDDKGNPVMKFELLNSGGSRQFDTAAIIDRYKVEMLIALLSDFMMVGHENNGGSYALHTDKSGLFRSAVNGFAGVIADVFNRYAIPRLFKLNGWRPDEMPRIVPNNVDPPNLVELAQFLTATAGIGASWFPDPTLQDFLRDAAGIPPLEKSLEPGLRNQQRQQAIIDLAQRKLEAIQIEQQAAQGAMGLQQQALGNQQAQQQLQAGPQQQVDPGDPDGKHAQAQAGAKTAQAQQSVAQSKLGTQQQQVRLAQEKAKLKNLRTKPQGRPAAKKAPARAGRGR